MKSTKNDSHPDSKNLPAEDFAGISDLKRTEEKLRVMHSEWENIFQSIANPVFIIKPDYSIITANRAALDALNIPEESIKGKKCFEIFHKGMNSLCQTNNCPIKKTLESGRRENAEIEIEALGGTFLVSCNPIKDKNGNIEKIIQINTDITDLKKLESELKEERGLFIEGPAVVVKWKNEHGWPVEYISPNVQAQFGYARESLESGKVRYADLIHPDDLERVTSEIENFAKMGQVCYEQEYRLLRSDHEYHWVHDFTRVIYDSNKNIVRFHGYIQDINDFKNAEMEKLRLETQIQHARKMESLGVMAGGIAHDFNNLLMAILGNANLAICDLPPDSSTIQYLKDIEHASKRAAELCKQMLAYSGKEQLVLEPLDLSVLINGIIEILKATISKKIEIKFNLHEDIPVIEADAAQIRQMVMNLILNAADAIGENRGIINVSTNPFTIDAVSAKEDFFGNPQTPGKYVCLEVSDNGCGMDSEIMSKIFDPFFTTKFIGRGLGLATVMGIVRSHKGFLTASSEPKNGSLFRIYFSASSKPSQHPEFKNSIPMQYQKTTKGDILLVDDEEIVRNLVKVMIERCGFSVVTAVDGADAIEKFKKHNGKFDFILLDLTMPKMGGLEAFNEIRKTNSGIPIFLSSGYEENDIRQLMRGKDFAGFIQKPYTFNVLAEKLKKIFIQT